LLKGEKAQFDITAMRAVSSIPASIEENETNP
jgi:hypothetical protein